MKRRFEISVAPMMDWTDRHCRYFHRLLNPDILLYTEMVTTGALLYGDRERFLRYNPAEHPVALQLGGSDQEALCECTRIAIDAGYDEINLNCGCPSDRVQNGAFGAYLMKQPERVARCIEAMQQVSSAPVTIKCRIGVDECDEAAFLDEFVRLTRESGCSKYIIHARKAWLKGLSPKENREVPPLNYARIYALKKQYPDLNIILNGGLKTKEEILAQQDDVDGVMIGRMAYQSPWLLRELVCEDQADGLPNRQEIIQAMIAYAQQQLQDFGTPLHSITRHMHGLFQGKPGAKAWRRMLSDIPVSKENDPSILLSQAV